MCRFNSYSSDKLVDTASKVCSEFSNLGLEPSEEFHGDDDFEFVSIFNAGDQVSVNGQVGQVFPVFNRDLLLDGDLDRNHEDEERVAGKPSSSSSSEADELERVPPGTYCVWTPRRSAPESPAQCKKSKSTGSSSKRWRLRDLLRRSNSDGKDSFVFLTPLSASKNMEDKVAEKLNIKEKKSSSSTAADHKVVKKIAGGKAKAKGTSEKVATAHEAFYVRNRKLKEGDKRRSYLPYRQDLVGFFANVNAMGRSFPTF
ncbi:hypothetical protein FNV43_RR14346 [Rhamnella rubrinervis]|uniref:Uncharacterized protein n=1 Tax=Rhamnella rubrinervis TaxID=2594499 RepID=A0A8K0MGC2_9ROSA|nr:hypothetical protein FNV43_RR14346 [Rhamnella rubrinervis]